MANNTGTLITAPVRPASPLDRFPSFHANEGKGGWHAVATLADRDAIPADRFEVGMRCWVEAEQTTYRLDDTLAWVEVSDGGGTSGSSVTYGEDFAANECFRIQDGVARKVLSTDGLAPWVDGVTLQSGSSGSSYPAALIVQQSYTSLLTLPAAPNRVLFLGQNGKLTPTPPTRAAGDAWLVRVARRAGDTQFIFAPGTPCRLA
jgi:hypothetical protein